MMVPVPRTPANDAAFPRTLSVATALALMLTGLSNGAVRTWTGGGANDNWSTGGNWGGTAPGAGDDIHFAGSTRLTPINDIAGGSFSSITFDAGAGPFVVTGNAVTLTGGPNAVTHNGSGNAALNLPIVLGTGSIFTNTSAGALNLGGSIALGSFPLTVSSAGNTELNGIISGSGSLAKTGGGTLKLSGANTYTGNTAVSAGILILNHASALGSAAGGVSVAAGSTLDLNGLDYSAAEPLTLNGMGQSNIGALVNSAGSAATFGGPMTLGAGSSIVGETGSIILTHTGAVSGGYPLVLAGTQGGSIAGAFASATLTKAGTGAWTLENDDSFISLTLSSGTLHLGSGRAHTVYSSLNLPGGNLDFGSSSLEFQGSSVDFGNLASIVPAGGTLRFASPSPQAFMPKPGAAFPPIVKSGTGTLSLNSYGLNAAGLAMNGGTWDWSSYTHSLGSITSASGNMLFNSSTVEITGDCDLSGLSALSTAGNTLSFTAASGTQTFTPLASYSLYAIVKSGAGSVLVAGSPLIANGFSMSAGTWNWGASAQTHSFATLIAAGGTMTFGPNTVKASGNVDLSGLAAINPGTGSLWFDGSGPRDFTPKPGAAHPKIIQSGPGTTTITGNSLLAGELSINGGTFNLGAGLNHAFASVGATWGTLDFASSTLRVTSGDATFSGLAGLTAGTGVLEFTGSAAQNLTPHSGSGLPALKQNGIGGTTILGYGIATPSIAIALGALHLGSGLTHASGDFASTGGELDFQTSTLDLSGSTLDFSGLTGMTPAGGTLGFQGSSSQFFTPMSGGVFPNLNKPGSGTVTLAGALTAGNAQMSNGALALGSFTHSVASFTASGGALDFGGSTLRVTEGQAYLGGLSSLTPGAGTLSFSGTGSAQLFTPKSGATHPAVAHTGTAILRLSDYALISQGFSQSAGTLDFNNQNITTAGNFTITNGTPSSLTGLGARTLTVAGNASLSGTSAGSRLNLDPGTAWTIAVTSGTLNAVHASIAYGTAAGAAGLCTNCAEGGGNANWSFSVTWDGGGTDNNWSTADNWGSKSVPTAGHDVAFDAGSGKNAILSANAIVRSLNMTGYAGTLDFSSFKLTIAEGDADFRGGETIVPGTGILEFAGSGSQTFHAKAGETFPNLLKTGGGTTTLGAGALTAGSLDLSGGAFNLGSAANTHSVDAVSGNGGLDFGAAHLAARGNVDLSNATVTVAASNILYFNGTGSRSFTPNASLTTLHLSKTGSGSLTVTGNGFVAPVLAVSAGALNLGASLAHTIGGFSVTGGSLDFGSSALQTTAPSMDFSAFSAITAGTGILKFSGAGSQTLTPHATMALPDIAQTGTGATTVITRGLKAGNVAPLAGTFHFGASLSHDLGGISMGGGPYGSLDFGGSQVRVAGNVDLGSLASLIPGTGSLHFDAASGTQIFVPKASGAAHPALFHGGAGTLRLSTYDLNCLGFTQTAGMLDFNGRDLTVSGSGNLGISNGTSNTLINLGGRTLTVGGAATLLGLPSDRLNLDPAAPWILSVSGALKAVNADIGNSQAVSSSGIADSSRDLAGNANWTFLDTLRPENVTAFQATALDGHSVAMAWNASAAADADSVMLRYRTDGLPPQHSGDGGLWRSVPAARTADTATGMADKTVFHFAAFAKDASGNFALKSGGSADSARTPDVTAPANVEAFTATATGPASAALSWSAPASTDVDSIVIRYRADGGYPSDASDGLLWKRLPASSLDETVTGLAPKTVYHFALFTRDSSGNSAPASVQARDTALYQPPVSGSVSIADNQGRTKAPTAALAFAWSDADSLRFALPADTAAAAWSGVRALDSLSIAAGPDGLRIILAQYKNIHGLLSPWYRDTTLLDRTAPAVTLAANAEHGWRTWPDALSGKALDAGAGTDSVHVIRKRAADGAYFNGAGWSTAPDTARLRADSVFSVPMPNSAMATGAYDFTAYARDRLGNASAPLTVRVNYIGNRPPALASATLADSLPQNQTAAWTLDVGEPDAGDSLGTLSATLPGWLAMTESADTARGGFASHRIYSLTGKPGQADVGNSVVTIQAADLGGRIFTYTKAIKVIDVNDPPIFAKGADSAYAKEDSITAYRPVYADQDPRDVHTLSLLQAPLWVAVKDSALVFKPGSRDAGTALVRVVVSDGKLADTLDLKVGAANVNDAPVAFPSARFETQAHWKEDVADSFTVVVVDMDKGDPVSLASVLPAWIGYQASVDPADGCNRFFRFKVSPKQADTGSLSLKLRFQDASGAFSELPLAARVAAVNDTPTAVIKESRTLAGAARIALDVSDQDGNAASTRFHYRLVAASGDTVRRGISAAPTLSLHPLADGAYRLAVRAEDEGGLKQAGFTASDLVISGATAIGIDSGRWSMIAYPGRSLPANALGSGHVLTTWDESSGDGSPLGRYASGPAADSLARGKGYWVRVAKPVSLAAPLAGLLDKPFALKLSHGRQGWNQVGNPFPYFVDLSASGLQFWEWDAARRDLANARGILKPWGAYWVQVARDTILTLRDEPYFASVQAATGAQAKSAGPAPRALAASEWTLQLFLQAGPYQDRANHLGIRNVTQAMGPMGAAGRAPGAAGRAPGAAGPAPGAAGRVPDAPKYGDYIALHFEKPGTAAIGAKHAGDTGFHAHATGYAEDFRNGMGDDEEWWDFSVENSQSGFSTASLSVPGLENLRAAGLHAFLVRRGQAALLTAGEPAMLAMEGLSTPYSLVVTPHADFAGRMRGDFSISQNFPNPVRTHTTFRFALPQTWDASGRREARSYRLRLNVYDYSGRLAARVAEGIFRPGTHSLVWKPQAVHGGGLAKGAYVYRLEVPGFSKSLKLLLK